MSPQLLRLKNAGADHVVLVANAPEGAQVAEVARQDRLGDPDGLALGDLGRALRRADR